ncbi:hypothetical protein BS47DRAFT_1092809 [Hydnum rufescens UP504]|uniref:Uncharacterized protein n=1 Tax=Hydnum rufescens UP504 TaxID=1448309 RepID=A0A9P6AUP0_9AGAM|nr:hypothetical protein BS47DRAFT_1092809 [Hydnum rufescens UP504]
MVVEGCCLVCLLRRICSVFFPKLPHPLSASIIITPYITIPSNFTTWGFVDADRNAEMLRGVNLVAFLHGPSQTIAMPSLCYTHFPLVTPTGQRRSMDHTLEKNGHSVQDFLSRRPLLGGTSTRRPCNAFLPCYGGDLT